MSSFKITDLIAGIKTKFQQLTEERNKYELAFKQLVADMSDDMKCLDSCDSYAHDDACPHVHPDVAFAKLRAELRETKQLFNVCSNTELYQRTVDLPMWRERTKTAETREANMVVLYEESEAEAERLRVIAGDMCHISYNIPRWAATILEERGGHEDIVVRLKEHADNATKFKTALEKEKT